MLGVRTSSLFFAFVLLLIHLTGLTGLTGAAEAREQAPNPPVSPKDLILAADCSHVYRHKDPTITGLFAPDCDGDIYQVIFDFKVLGFGTKSGKAPISPMAVGELTTLYQVWLDGPNPPTGETRANIERALQTARGNIPAPVPAVAPEAAAFLRQAREAAAVSTTGKLPVSDYQVAERLWKSLRASEKREWVTVDASTKKLKVSKAFSTPHFSISCQREGEQGTVECQIAITRYEHFYFGEFSFLAEFGGREAADIASAFDTKDGWYSGTAMREVAGSKPIPFSFSQLHSTYDYASYGDSDIPVWRICFFKIGSETYVHLQKSIVGGTIDDLFAREGRSGEKFELFRPRSYYSWYDGPVENSRVEFPRNRSRQLFSEPIARPSRTGNWRDQAVRDPTGP